MNTKFIVWIIGLFIGVIVVAAIWYTMLIPKSAPPPAQSGVTLPAGGSISQPAVTTTTVSTPEATTTQTMTVLDQTGGLIVTRDFLHNGVTLPDTANPGRYILAGKLGYCFDSSQKCQAAPATDYNVYYESQNQSFVIALTQEPIGPARESMEQFMRATLGVGDQQLCSLKYFVGVTRYISERFSNSNLGFSFCPGATVLPN